MHKDQNINTLNDEAIDIQDLGNDQDRNQEDMQPEEIFMAECSKFTKQNLEKDIFKIDEYDISQKDIEESYFAEYLDPSNFQIDNSSKIQKNYKNLPNDKKQKLHHMGHLEDYQTVDIKILQKLINIEGRQQMVIKTWEKVKHLCSGLFFYIKTLRVYDSNNQMIFQTMTEQVDGVFLNDQFYETSILQFKNFIYYFKRVQHRQELTENIKNDQNEHSNSYLQLMKLDLSSVEESIMDDYIIIEPIDPLNPQTLNIMFSHEFGDQKQEDSLYEDEEDFLKKQYLFSQKYIQKEEAQGYKIFKLDNLEKSILNENEDLSQSKQIFFVFHQHLVLDQIQHKTIFIMINQNQHIHITYDSQIQNCHSEIFKSSFITKRLLPSIHIQNHLIELKNKNQKLSIFKQSYFMDLDNQIQLLYPNYQKKENIFQMTDFAKMKLNLKNLNQQNYKMINVIDFCDDRNYHESNNIVREIWQLKKILNLRQINQSQIFTFCCDQYSQVLYVTDLNFNKIIVAKMMDKDIQILKNQYEIIQKRKDGQHAYKKIQKHKTQALVQKDFKQQTVKKSENHQLVNNLRDMMQVDYDILMLQENHRKDQILLDIVTQNIINQVQVQLKNLSKRSNIQTNTLSQKVKNERKLEQILKHNRNFNGNLNNISISDTLQKLHSINAYNEDLIQIQDLKLENIIKNQYHYFIVFSALNFINCTKKKTYFLIKKTKYQIQILINDSIESEKLQVKSKNVLISNNTQIQIFKSDFGLEIIEFKDLYEYQETRENSEVNLVFEKLSDYKLDLQYFAFISQNKTHSQIMLYDMNRQQILYSRKINLPKECLKYALKDDDGFNIVKLARTTLFRQNKSNLSAQNFQVFIFFNEKLGRILIQDLVVQQQTQRNPNLQNHDLIQILNVQEIGVQEILLSPKCIQNLDLDKFKSSQVVPFIDQELNCKGSQLNLRLWENCSVLINQSNDNYFYKSQIAALGCKQYFLENYESDIFILVVSAKMNNKILKQNIFQQYELQMILKKYIEMLFQMRKADLKYIIMNKFESLIEEDFFTNQQILNGKSICDLCINSPKLLVNGLSQFKIDIDQNHKNSYHSILFNESRSQCFTEIGFDFSQKINNIDFDFKSTIQKAIKLNAQQSIQEILQYVLGMKFGGSQIDALTMEIPGILEKKFSIIDQFFDVEQEELNRGYNCNLERQISISALESCSFQENRIGQIQKVIDEYQLEQQIIDQFCEMSQEEKQRQEGKDDNQKDSNDVSHSYIDFKWLILGEKLKHVEQGCEKQFVLDQEYLSELMLKQEESLKFYGCSSVQKIIEFQFQKSKIYMRTLFYFYLFCFVLPFGISLVFEGYIEKCMIFFCQIPQIFLLIMEIIQIKENGWKYFIGWNIVDFAQIILYQIYFLKEFKNNLPLHEIEPFIKMILIVLTYLKTLHFVSVYEEFGFFLKMLEVCTYDLLPFTVSFIVFGMFFAIMYAILGVEPHEEIIGGTGIGYFGLLFVSVWRNGLSKIGYPVYDYLFKMPETFENNFQKYFVIYLIWILYFIQIMMQFVVGLNLMIAIVEQTYSQVSKKKYFYIYRNMAQLNQECFQLLKYFKKIEEVRVLIFSYQTKNHSEKKLQLHRDNQEFFYYMDEIEKQIDRNNQLQNFDQYNKEIELIKKEQESFNKQFNQNYVRYQMVIRMFQKQMKQQLVQVETMVRGK